MPRTRTPRQWREILDAFDRSDLSQAEAETAFVEALHGGFAEDREPGELDLGEVLNESVPLAVSMSESMERLRQWAKGRARHASAKERQGRGGRQFDLG